MQKWWKGDDGPRPGCRQWALPIRWERRACQRSPVEWAGPVYALHPRPLSSSSTSFWSLRAGAQIKNSEKKLLNILRLSSDFRWTKWRKSHSSCPAQAICGLDSDTYGCESNPGFSNNRLWELSCGCENQSHLLLVHSPSLVPFVLSWVSSESNHQALKVQNPGSGLWVQQHPLLHWSWRW